MSNEILRLKATLASPYGKQSYVSNVNISGSQSVAPLASGIKGNDLIKIHKKLMKNDNSDEDDDHDEMESEIDVLPDKTMAVYTEQGTSNVTSKPHGLNIPKLDLAKAFKIQEINAKKSTMQQLQKQQGSDIGAVLQQLKKVEGELTIAKKNLQREMLMNKTLTIENENLKRFNIELESRNETLVSSSIMYEETWQKIFKTFQYYRDFYKKNSGQNNQPNVQLQRTNRSQNNREKSFLGVDILNTSAYNTTINRIVTCNNLGGQNLNYTTNNDTQMNGDPDRIMTSKVVWRKDVSNKHQESRTMLDINNNDINLDEEIYKIDPQFQKEYAKSYLLNIAKDVYGIFNKQQRNNNSPQPRKGGSNLIKMQSEYRLKRSLSNPLDYMNDHGKDMVIQNIDQNLDRSDIAIRNFTALVGQDQSEPRAQQKYKELNDVLSNQEILIQFTEQNMDERTSSNKGIALIPSLKPKQLHN